MTRPIPDSILTFWQQFETTVGDDVSDRFQEAFYFCDNEEDADELANLVLRGTKRATASLRWSYEAEGERLPKVGDLSVVTNWAKKPLCVIETVQVDVVAYEEVSEEFAAVEGEGDGSLRYWREAHWDFFSRECEGLGVEPSMQMPVICERFRVIYVEEESA